MCTSDHSDIFALMYISKMQNIRFIYGKLEKLLNNPYKLGHWFTKKKKNYKNQF